MIQESSTVTQRGRQFTGARKVLLLQGPRRLQARRYASDRRHHQLVSVREADAATRKIKKGAGGEGG